MLIAKVEDNHFYLMNDFCRLLDKDALLESCEKERVHGFNRVSSSKKRIDAAEDEERDCGEEIRDIETRKTGATQHVDKTRVESASGYGSEDGSGDATREAPSSRRSGGEEEDAKDSSDKSTPKLSSWKDAIMRAKTVAGQKQTDPSRESNADASSSKTTATKRSSPSKGKESSSIPSKGKKGPNTSLFISKLTAHTTEEEVKAIYGTFGPITEVKLVSDRGHGFIKYKRADSVKRALDAQAKRNIQSPYLIEEKHTQSRNRGGTNGRQRDAGRRGGARRAGSGRGSR